MSMINDALKRAKQAQQQTSLPPPDLPLRPVEPGQQRARHSLGLLLPAALALVALFALLLVWQWAQTHRPGESAQITARALVPAKPAQPDWSAQPAPAPVPVAVAADLPAVSPATAPAAAAPTTAQETNLPAAALLAAPTPPKPVPLRLQGILFNPRRPSAVINGKTFFVGDKLGALRVVAISQDSATLAGSGQTTILTLSD